MGTISTVNKYLFADLLVFMSAEGDEATLPSLTSTLGTNLGF